MKKKTRPRLTRGEIILSAFIAAAVLLICLGIFSPGHNPLYIFSPQPSASLGTPSRYFTKSQGHWQKGDSVYDAASQAKLIALSNTYYDTSDEDAHVVISEIANKIRNHAGLAGDDCLIEDAAVLPLGQKLDAEVSLGALTKEKLLELQKPYVGVHPADTSQDGVLSATYTFGKADIIMTRAPDTAASGNGAVIKYDVTLTVKAHYNAYVIYNAGWEKDCADAVNALEAAGIPAPDIGTASITSYLKFTDSWNSIDLTPSGLSVPYVIIDTHATPTDLDSDTYRISTGGISQLENKHIERLMLLGCNAGHLNFMETNPAAAFAKKIYGGFVLASDGNVFNIGADKSGVLQYESRDDETFQAYIGTNGRSSLGWMVYRYSGGKIITFSTSVYVLTISGILDYFEPVYF